MIRMVNRSTLSTVFTAVLLVLIVGSLSFYEAQAGDSPGLQVENSSAKIEPFLLEQFRSGDTADFFIWMEEKADLSGALLLEGKAVKGGFVYQKLVATAEGSQEGVRNYLDRKGLEYRSFYIANKILVHNGALSLVYEIASRPDVSKITANHEYQLKDPFVDPLQPPPPDAVGSNISFVHAPEVWAMGYDGMGIVLAGNDTGLDWDHPAIINHYRGWDGFTADHNYNWWDATGYYTSAPGDGHGHGTHTTGTMVGDDGGSNQIGIAPGAQTIHCKNMSNSGIGSDATFSECFEFDLAPWDLNGQNPDPLKAPDAVNNSWGYFGGSQPQFEDEIAALQAAGILVEVSAGNEGPSCSSLRSPGDYAQVLTTGSINHASGSLPGTLTASSSRGPSPLYPGDYFPDVMAPGEGIRSSLPGGGYASWSGTSMSGPHTTGLVALIWDASPNLRGDIERTVQAIADTAVPLLGQAGSSCGGDYITGPNNDWGYGTIDALAAVNEGIRLGAPFEILLRPDQQSVCTPQSGLFDVDVIQVAPTFSDPVFLDIVQNPPGASTLFNPNPIIPPGTSIMNVDTSSASPGDYQLAVTGVSGAHTVTETVNLSIYTQAPAVVSLLQPADGASGVPLVPLLEWSASAQTITYTLEVATDIDFTNIVYAVETVDAMHQPAMPLEQLTTYFWRVRAANVCGTNGYSSISSFTTRNQLPVLLVDDDDNVPDMRPYYTETLDALGYVYDIWDTNNSDNEPDVETLSDYNIVVWFTGDEFLGSAGPGPDGEAALSSWLDASGCLLLTSQDYFYDRGLTSFMQQYLGVESALSDRGQTTVTGAGSLFNGLGPYSLQYPSANWSDVINPDATAETAFSGNAGSAAVSKATTNYLTTFLGFPLEAIPNVLDRRDVAGAFIDACPGDPPPEVAIYDPVQDQTVSGTYRILVDATDNGSITQVGLSIDGGAPVDITANFDGTYYFYDWETTDFPDGLYTVQASAIDNTFQSSTSAPVNVNVLNNSAPVASFNANCTGLVCSFDASASFDPDGDALAYDWDFGDGLTDTGQIVSHGYIAGGTYTVTLTVSDPGGLEDISSQEVIASLQTMHVSDLDGYMTNAPRGRWNANVTITIFDQDGAPLDNVLVNGEWRNGASGEISCLTDGFGQCLVISGDIKSNVASVDYAVTSLARNGYIYDPADNGDPDGDSDGSVITVFKDPPEPPPPPPGDDAMHLAGLEGSSTPAPRGGKWNAVVTVAVHGVLDGQEQPAGGVTVSGSWSGGITGGGSCTTDASGTCSIVKSNIKSNVSSVTFTVDDLVDSTGTYYYEASDNHDGSGLPIGPNPSVDILRPSLSLIE